MQARRGSNFFFFFFPLKHGSREVQEERLTSWLTLMPRPPEVPTHRQGARPLLPFPSSPRTPPASTLTLCATM